MQQERRSLVLAAALAATAFSAAQDGDIGAGYALARETCRACHMVEAEETLATGTRT
jgi:mono/diheme cytochrome c family protein